MRLDVLVAARSILLPILLLASAAGLGGCLKTDIQVVTAESADYPFKKHLLVQIYEKVDSGPKGYGLIDLDNNQYRWTALALERPRNPGGYASGSYVYMKSLPGLGYILADGLEIGVLRRAADGFFYVYTDLGSADCERLGRSESVRLRLRRTGADCIAPSFESVVSVVQKVDWSRRAPSFAFRIIKESDEPVAEQEPDLAELKKRCDARVTEDTVKPIIAEHLGVAQGAIVSQSRFKDLHADDLDMIELTMAFEEEFDFLIPEDDVKRMTTVQSAIDMLRDICFRSG